MSTRPTVDAPCVFTLVARVFCILLPFSGIVGAKVYDRCELAQVLHQRHQLDLHEVATWTCIAQHSSGFNTEAYAGGLDGGSHGLFQISDVYWCSPPGKGFACNLPCERLRDADLTDDLRCLRTIYDEHQRLSGDGYNAWNAYQQFCRHDVESYVADCFPNQSIAPVAQQTTTHSTFASAQASYYISNDLEVHTNSISDSYSTHKRGKIYDRCELAQELYYKHKMPMEQIPTWVCIAQHESKFDTSAVGRLNADGSADHGLFQISDLYWCSHDRYSGGKACGLQCTKLLDNDISDDVRCIKRIHGEHTRISGDGFTAWTVYERNCRNQQYSFVSKCFQEQPLQQAAKQTHVQTSHSHTFPSFQAPQVSAQSQFQANPYLKYNGVPPKSTQTLQKHQQHKYTSPKIVTQTHNTQTHKGKVYKRCELAQELYFKHKFPIQDIATWVCIAQHESNYNTAAVGRLNGDGSADHGLFQISDLYWCAHEEYGGKACNIPCAKLLDSDISDDVRCIRIIHEEHTRISGDGFTAWTVYNHHCRNQKLDRVASCFPQEELNKPEPMQPAVETNKVVHGETGVAVGKGKIYKKCELAQELYFKHKMPMKDVPTWVCIAQHESSFNTAAVGRLNADGSADHGLFQISDLYWCSHEDADDKACHISCNKLLDNDITDDVRCVKTIYEEHTRLSGDGFTAWTVYNRNCRNQQLERISACFNSELLQQAQEANEIAQPASHSTTIKTSSHTQQQNIRPTPSNTEKYKLHVYPTKPYVNSEVFRTTPVKIPAALTEFKPGVETKFSTTVTSGRPITTITQKPQTQTTKQYYTNLLITTTTRRPTTPVESATKRPSTTWKWQQPQQVQPVKAAATQKPTTRVPATEAKPFVSTTRPPQTTARTTKLKNNQKSVTNKGSTPQTSTTTTTRKSQTTKNPGLYQEKKTTWNTLATATTKRPTATTKTTQNVRIQKPSTTTTTRKPTTTQNAGLRKPTTVATTRKPTTKQSVTKPTSKSTNDKTANLIATTTTTRKPGTTVRAPLTQKTTAAARTTTKRPTTTTQRATKYTTTNSKLNSKYSSTKVQQQHFATTSTRKPTTTVRTPLKQNTFAATKPPANTQPSRRPATASLNNFSTTKVPYTTKKITTTTPFTQYTKSSTQKPKVTTTKQTALTNTISNTRGTTRKPAFYVANTMNEKPNVLKNQVHTTPTKAALTVTTAKYREDPFSHPFFDKYKEQFKVFDTTTTRKPTSAVTQKSVQAHFGEESEYYKQFRNHASGSAKTVYAYAFGQNGTLAGHYGR